MKGLRLLENGLYVFRYAVIDDGEYALSVEGLNRPAVLIVIDSTEGNSRASS